MIFCQALDGAKEDGAASVAGRRVALLARFATAAECRIKKHVVSSIGVLGLVHHHRAHGSQPT